MDYAGLQVDFLGVIFITSGLLRVKVNHLGLQVYCQLLHWLWVDYLAFQVDYSELLVDYLWENCFTNRLLGLTSKSPTSTSVLPSTILNYLDYSTLQVDYSRLRVDYPGIRLDYLVLQMQNLWFLIYRKMVYWNFGIDPN